MKKGMREEVFNDTATACKQIIAKLRRLKVLDSELYFCTKETMATLIGLRAQLEGSYLVNVDSDRYGFGKILNLINPTDIAHTYSIGLTSKYRTIIKMESVDENIEGEFAVWRNRYKKEQLEFAEVHQLEGDAYEQHIKKMEHALTSAQANFEFLKENRDDLDVLICGYDHAKSYAQLVYFGSKGKTQKHLSTKVPNILALELAPYQKGMKVAEIIKRGVNAFGDVYFMKKEETPQ